jgi:hypothetical protein
VPNAVDEILLFYKNYDSSRWVGSQLVMRIYKPLTKRAASDLNKQFADVLRKGEIVQGGSLPQEQNQPEIAYLPRLILTPHRAAFGRYRQLIDAINRAETAPQA